MELVESNPNAPVVVLAGSSLRSAPLDRLAAELRQRGATVEVVAGVDRRRVDLLKLSFRYRAEAAYLLFGGPELREDTLTSIAVELEANGVPKARISGAMMRWDDAEDLTRQAVDRLAAMGVDVEDVGPSLPRPTLVSVPPPAPPRGPGPQLPRPRITGPQLPVSPPRPSPARIPGAAWALGGLAAVAAVAVLGISISSGDAAAEEPEEPGVRAASVFAMPASAHKPTPSGALAEDANRDELGRLDENAPDELELDVVDESADALPAAPLDAAPPTLSGDDAALVYAALRKQSIRALDILLVSPPASRQLGRRTLASKMNFEAARDHCESLDVDGVGGWRLPDIGEVQWLSKSNLIRTGIYWTDTKADAFGSERVIWNPRSKRMRSSNQRWRGGRVVCVRYQNGEDPGPR